MYGLLRLAIRDICGGKREKSRYPRHLLLRTENELNRARIREKNSDFFFVCSVPSHGSITVFFPYLLLQELGAAAGCFALVHMQAWAWPAAPPEQTLRAWRRSGMGNRFESIGEGFLSSYLLVGGPLELVVLLGEADLLHHVPAATGGGGNNRVREREGRNRESPGERRNQSEQIESVRRNVNHLLRSARWRTR